MLQPLLAASLAGFEIMFILPALGMLTLAGFIAFLLRARLFAIVCGILCGIVGIFAFYSAAWPQPDNVRYTDAVLGGVGVVVALLLYICRRKRHDNPA
jgi:uncharacterized membrane protein YedE/YeeE